MSLMAPTLSVLVGLQILVVDSNFAERELLTVLFELEGAEVLAVASAEEALKVLELLEPDLLISELVLAGDSGYSLMWKIRSHSSQHIAQIPAIALTSAAREEDRRLAHLAGFQKHLAKPVEIVDILDAIASLAR